uniref:Uncharacterized protein n=1 Tax=Capra hircus TaxID=9925 RepID=A0A8C2NKL5_CAPHI
MTLPTALVAPVEAGMMFWAAPRPSRHSFPEGPSTVFWVAVMAWTVVCRRRRGVKAPPGALQATPLLHPAPPLGRIKGHIPLKGPALRQAEGSHTG